jgi:hypothetical protein
MSNEYAIDDKCFLLNRALYDLRKSSLLWLKEFSSTLIILNTQLHQISREFCLWFDYHDIIFFFYVNDIVVIYSTNREIDVDRLINKLYQRFELRDMRRLIFFLSVRVIQNDNNIYLYQNSYMNKLTIEYQMNMTKSFISSLSIDFIDAFSYASRSSSKVN